MNNENNLNRFIQAQETSFEMALTEVRNGRKRSHWMWYIFPQIKGLGFSPTSVFYGIEDIKEAESYLKHPVLGSRLIRICTALLELKDNDASRIFGYPDDLKLKSSMTLFSSLPTSNPLFTLVLNKFFKGTKDKKTLEIINRQNKSNNQALNEAS